MNEKIEPSKQGTINLIFTGKVLLAAAALAMNGKTVDVEVLKATCYSKDIEEEEGVDTCD